MGRAPAGSAMGLKSALAVYALLFVLKLGAWWVTGLFALIAEALHTLSDLMISTFLLVADRVSRRPADARYRYGYGRVQHMAALVAATLFISFTSFRLAEEAVGRLLSGATPAYSRLGLAIGVLVFSMAVSAVPIVLLGRQPHRGPAARAQLLESLNDELGLLAAAGGALLVLNGWSIADAFASLAVALLIAANAAGLFRDNARVLMGRAPDREFFKRIETLARTVPAVKAVHDLRAQYMGPDAVNLSLHAEVDPTMTVADGEEVAKAVRAAIMTESRCAYCVVHVDPLGAPPEPDELDF